MIRILLLFLLLTAPTYALDIKDLETPKDIQNRIGTSKNPETPIIVESKTTWDKKRAKLEKFRSDNITYADLSLKKNWSQKILILREI